MMPVIPLWCHAATTTDMSYLTTAVHKTKNNIQTLFWNFYYFHFSFLSYGFKYVVPYGNVNRLRHDKISSYKL